MVNETMAALGFKDALINCGVDGWKGWLREGSKNAAGTYVLSGVYSEKQQGSRAALQRQGYSSEVSED